MNGEVIVTIWKCSDDKNEITSELTGQVSRNNHTLQLCRWANCKVGAIFPLNGTILYFSEISSGSSRNNPQLDLMPTNSKNLSKAEFDSHIVSCGGIVARWLIDSSGLHPDSHGIAILNDSNFRKNILHNFKEEPFFDTLYETHLEAARTKALINFESLQNERRKKLGAWKLENKKFMFSLEEHLKEERTMTEYDERHLYPFFRQEDVEFMRAIAQDYQEFIQYKINTQSTDVPPPSENEKKPKNEKHFKPIQNTFEIANTTVERLKQVFQFCIDNMWLDKYTLVDDWLKLFAGVPSPVCMIWDVEKSDALRDLFYMMVREKDAERKTFLKPCKNYLQVVSSHFVSEKPSKNNPRPYITDFIGRNNKKEYEQRIEYCRRVLKGEDINKIIDEMLQNQNKLREQKERSIMEEAMSENIQINRDNAALQDYLHGPRKNNTSNYDDE